MTGTENGLGKTQIDLLPFSKTGIPNFSDYLMRAHEDGFQGIGESHPWVQGFSIEDGEWMQAMELPLFMTGPSIFM